MSNLTDRAAYLRGVADGLALSADKPENKLLLELLGLVDEMAHTVSDMNDNLDELTDFVDEIDEDLESLEDYLFEDDDDDECGCDCDECDCDDCEEIHFDCPNCGKAVVVNPEDIEAEESPVCPYCGEPFFTDFDEEDEEKKDE